MTNLYLQQRRTRIDKGFQNGHFWELFHTSNCYTLYVDDKFYCTCDSRVEAYNELQEVA